MPAGTSAWRNRAQLLIAPKIIQNPVLRGYHPDPSFVRVGEDFYLASSTFMMRRTAEQHEALTFRDIKDIRAEAAA